MWSGRGSRLASALTWTNGARLYSRGTLGRPNYFATSHCEGLGATLDGSRPGDKANLPTEHAPSEAQARFPCPHEDTGGPCNPEEAPCKGPRAPFCLKAQERKDQRMTSGASLRRGRDFERVRARGRRARSDGVSVFVARAATTDTPPRLGLAVGRDTGNAVMRNRIRRRLREAWRASEPPPGHDAIVRATADVATMDFQNLVEHVRRAVTRATAGNSR